jgi:hypothetical protein
MSPAYAPTLFVTWGDFVGGEDPSVLGASERLRLRKFGDSQLLDDGIDLNGLRSNLSLSISWPADIDVDQDHVIAEAIKVS